MKRTYTAAAILITVLTLSACGHRSSADFTPTSAVSVAADAPKPAAQVIVTDEDITNRRYVSLGDISVSVSKNTIFDSDPTPDLVAKRLREEAAKMGADAVVLARYGTVGMSMFSWGSMEGKGRAVRFAD